MRWDKFRRSTNVEQASGRGGGMGFGGMPRLGIGGIVIVLIVSLVFRINPLEILGLVSGADVGTQAPAATSPADRDDPEVDFVSAVLGSTEDVWTQIFRAGGANYAEPTLTLFRGSTSTACGTGQSAMGPFYCPGDQHVYLDLSFFRELETKFNASGDFARAYVIAHEVGHHVQNLTGVFRATAEKRRRGARMEGADGLSVRQELQADCYAGVWANHAQRQLSFLEPGDIESALAAASGVGDDTLQKQGRGYAVPDSFTHGSSAQRVRWFKSGFTSGDVGVCDTFAAPQL